MFSTSAFNLFLLKYIIDILMSGLSFRQYKQISKCKCHWNTI